MMQIECDSSSLQFLYVSDRRGAPLQLCCHGSWWSLLLAASCMNECSDRSIQMCTVRGHRTERAERHDGNAETRCPHRCSHAGAALNHRSWATGQQHHTKTQDTVPRKTVHTHTSDTGVRTQIQMQILKLNTTLHPGPWDQFKPLLLSFPIYLPINPCWLELI